MHSAATFGFHDGRRTAHQRLHARGLGRIRRRDEPTCSREALGQFEGGLARTLQPGQKQQRPAPGAAHAIGPGHTLHLERTGGVVPSECGERLSRLGSSGKGCQFRTDFCGHVALPDNTPLSRTALWGSEPHTLGRAETCTNATPTIPMTMPMTCTGVNRSPRITNDTSAVAKGERFIATLASRAVRILSDRL